MVRNGIFLSPERSLTEKPILTAAQKKCEENKSRDKRKTTMSIEETLERERLGGLLNSTREPRQRRPRLVVLPSQEEESPPLFPNQQLCSDDHCLDAGYDKLKRPHLGSKKPLRVGIELDGLRILEVEDKSFSISIQMYLGVRWTEPRMSGPDRSKEEEDYYDYYYYFSNDTFVALDTKFVRHLWVPDLYVYDMKYGSRVLKDFDGKEIAGVLLLLFLRSLDTVSFRVKRCLSMKAI